MQPTHHSPPGFSHFDTGSLFIKPSCATIPGEEDNPSHTSYSHSPPHQPKFGIFFARPSFLGLWKSYESNQPTRLVIQLLGGLIILLPTNSSVYSSTLQPSFFEKTHQQIYVLSFFVSLLFSIREPNKWTKQKMGSLWKFSTEKTSPSTEIGPSFSSLMLNFPNNERLNTCYTVTTTGQRELGWALVDTAPAVFPGLSLTNWQKKTGWFQNKRDHSKLKGWL